MQRGQRRDAGRRSILVEREIEAILKFPDQNPNPVLRTTADGILLYANPASGELLAAIGGIVGEPVAPDLFARLLEACDAQPVQRLEVLVGQRTVSLLPVRVADLGVINIYGTDVTAEEVVAKFPDQNPNPVLRADAAGVLIYANAASAPIVDSLGLRVGDALPVDLRDAIRRQLAEGSELIELRGGGRIFAITSVAVPEFGFTNLYGTDVTGLRAIDRFPNENPNPVLRVSREGTLTYANPASAAVRRSFRAEVGERVEPTMWARLQAAAANPDGNTIEVEYEERLYALKVVSVYEFDSINVYGTDITAAREVERLLLNILPKSIADRLRAGERVIADRFDEIAVLFADVVSFTPYAVAHPPADVVRVLNAIFSIFDQLADDYGLEKIKTIGDAYMVVGGIQDDPDGPERVARMGLEMIERLRSYRTDHGDGLEIRVGMHVGPAIGGVIGLKKFIYDVWGETVNTASRMESHGVPGRLQVTESARRRLEHAFAFESRGVVEVKGQGPMATHFMLGPLA